MCDANQIDPRREIVYRMGVLAIVMLLILHVGSLVTPGSGSGDPDARLAAVRHSLTHQLSFTPSTQPRGLPADLEFTRGLGPAGALPEVKGSVSFAATGAEVLSPGTAYRRTLSPAETAYLAALARGLLSTSPSSRMETLRAPSRYSASLAEGKGKSRALHLSPADTRGRDMLKWVQAETERISSFRLAHREPAH